MKRAISILVVAIAATTAFADGMVIPPPGIAIYEPYQYAVIEHDGSTETLHLLVHITGDSSEFGWIVPLPGTPEITEDTVALFEEILDMSNPEYGYGFGCMAPTYGGRYDDENGYYHVNIIEEGSVGVLDWTTLAAKDPGKLFSWLRDNGFPITDTTDTSSGQDSLRAVDIFADYISRGWIFVVFTIGALPDSDVNLQPVKFTFTSADIVYPMKISSLNEGKADYYDPYYDYYYDDYLELYLFVISDHRVDVETGCGDISYTYANKLTKSEYAAMQKHYPEVSAICKEADFITRIEARFWDYEEVDADYVLAPADDDKETYYGYAYGGPAFILLPLALIFGGAGLLRAVRRRRKS